MQYRTLGRSFILLLLVFVFSLSAKAWATVAGEVNKANGLYGQGKYDDSLDLYKKALNQDDRSSVIKYDLGTALYKKGDYAKALSFLEQAAQDKNIKIKPRAEYNLGNVLYRSGVQKENTNVDEAIKSLQEALGHYGQSLTIDPQDQDALFNQDFVKKEIERLKQQKKKQQQQQNKQDQKNQQNKQDQQSQQNNKEQQEKKKDQNDQENQQNQNNQQNQKQQQEQQDNKQSSAAQTQKKQSPQAQAEEDQKQLDRKQAEDLLEEYQDNEEPKKLLSYMPKKIDDRPVLKDW